MFLKYLVIKTTSAHDLASFNCNANEETKKWKDSMMTSCTVITQQSQSAIVQEITIQICGIFKELTTTNKEELRA